MAIDFDKIDRSVDLKGLQADVEDAKKNGGGDFPTIPAGKYEVKLESMEIKGTKADPNRPMLAVSFKILSGEFKNQRLFMNRVLYGTKNDKNMIASAIMILGRAFLFRELDDHIAGGISMMGFIAFVMLIAGGYAAILKETGAVNELIQSVVPYLHANKILAATIITAIGLVVTMGIGTSFGTVPILAVIYVPLCSAVGFSLPAPMLLMSAAGALGDAGTPASDTTLGPTSGLNADGQHEHIWDTCVPTFIAYNIPLMIAGIVGAQFL